MTQLFRAENRIERKVKNTLFSKSSVIDQGRNLGADRSYGCLKLFRETTLGGEQREVELVVTDTQLVVIPLVGKINFSNSYSQYQVEVGEVCVLLVKAGNSFMIKNLIREESSHYVLAGFESSIMSSGTARFSLDQNKFQTLFDFGEVVGLRKLIIGQCDGRTKGVFEPYNSSYSYAFIIQGAFELQECLLEKGDGLGIGNEQQIDFESLSNNAILLILEFQ